MALREKFGRLVLLEETEVSALGREFRAARLGPAGLDRLVTLTCFAQPISSHAAATKRLMEEARLAARLQNAGLVRVLGIGRVEQTFYVSTELVEGRTVAAVLERCARDSFPFAAEHGLMIASRAAAALEYLHSKKDEAGHTLFHGLLAPSRLVVAFDGEVKLKGLGLWPALRDSGLLDEAQRARLAPEQRDGAAGDPRSDVYALALVLLEALTGSLPAEPLAVLPQARLTNAAGESLPLPKPLLDLLCRALARDPLARFGTVAEMRKGIDTLLFSGDFTPTTFDLAFFMHTLFREEMERESREIEEARRADYREFIEDKGAAAAAAPAAAPSGADAPPILVDPVAATILTGPAVAATVVTPAAPLSEPSPAPLAAAVSPEPAVSREAPRPAREVHAREVAPKLTFTAATAAATPSRRGLWIALAAVGVLAAAGAGVFYATRRPVSATTTATTLSPEAVAAMQRVKQLEERIAQLERERAEAEAKAADEAKKKLESQAAAKGRAVDPAALERAQEEARVRARAEQEKKQQEELARLAEARKAEEKRLAEASPTPPATSTTTAPADAAAAGSTGGAATSGTEAVAAVPQAVVPTPAVAATPLVTEAVPEKEARVVPPMLLSQTPPRYPPIAQQRGIDGVVELTALVDETGHVAEVRVTRAQPAKIGFEEAAMQHARTRRYKPATKDGTPIRMVVPIVVRFNRSR